MAVDIASIVGYVSDRRKRSLVTACAAVVVAGILEAVKDDILAHVPVAVLGMTVTDSIIVGCALGLAIWLLLASFRERRARVRADLERIAEINHEVRNALQVVVDSQFDAHPERRRIVIESVDRINVVLNRLLPVVGGRGQALR